MIPPKTQEYCPYRESSHHFVHANYWEISLLVVTSKMHERIIPYGFIQHKAQNLLPASPYNFRESKHGFCKGNAKNGVDTRILTLTICLWILQKMGNFMEVST